MQDNNKSTEQANNKGHLLDRYSVQPKQEEDKSPFYKSAAPSISLPKGGGALKGIDEKFSVNAVNGTAGLEIALPLTPGRGGFTPALSLSYNSGSGNSEFGLGWGLSLPAIQRRTDKKLPLYNDEGESDVFLLAGAEDLVPYIYGTGELKPIYPSGYTVKRYRPRIEGLFARIEFIKKTGTTDSWWRLTTKDNITTYYGLGAEARISDPDYPTRTFKWLPQLTLDHKGNVQCFRYKAENPDNIADVVFEKNRKGPGAAFAQKYLKRVQYCNKNPWFTTDADTYEPGLPDAAGFLMEAILDYGDQADIYNPSSPALKWPSRNDAFSDCHAGFEIRTYRKCKRVLIYHYFSELDNKFLVRGLELQYKNEGLSPQALSEADYITRALQTAYDYKGNAWHSKSLPPMTFDYESLQWDTTLHTVSKDNFKHAPQGLTGPYQWTDFEGEGIAGILTEQGNGWFYKNNLGEGNFGSARTIAPKPNFSGFGSGLQWQDLDADGRRQVVSSDGAKGFWELEDYDPEDPDMLHWAPFRNFQKNINIDWNSPFTKMLDLDGDGRAEVLITEDRAWTWFQNEGTQGFSNGGHASVFTDEEKGPLLLLRDTIQSIFLADMSGDGLTDLVRIKNGTICYWPNMGYGKFGAKVTMANAPYFANADQYNPIYLSFADISGTGAADLIYTDGKLCKAWINMAGNGWGEAINFGPLPGTDPYSKIAVLDFLGNGTGCLVWSSPLPAHSHTPIRYMDLMGGKKPYLMKGYHNGTGKEVRVIYKSSTLFYLDDKLDGKPWATRLPFPVHCISSVTTEDKVSETHYTQLYRYRHGYYDHEEREFRGFGYVETIDVERAQSGLNTELDQKPVLTKTWNHTGAWIREGSLLDSFKKEYFHFEGWDDLTVIATFEGALDAQESREAHRALKGLPLRKEVYALDDTPLQDIPYSVTASAYIVKKIQETGDNLYASFLSLQEQSVAFSCERDVTDPRIAHSFTLETDVYGNVTKSAQIAYARKVLPDGLPAKVEQEQQKIHISYSENNFTGDLPIDNRYYRLRLPFEAKSFEVNIAEPLAPLYTREELDAILSATAIDFTGTPALGEKRLLSHNRSLLLSDDTLTVLPAGKLADPVSGKRAALAIPYESYALVFTPDIINKLYNEPDQVPPVIRVDAPLLLEGGYRPIDGNYWLPSGTAGYQSPETCFYTPTTFKDPWGNITTVAFWNSSNAYWLLPESVTDALGNSSAVMRYNWRNLQAIRLKDANDNISEIAYDALGLPVAMAIRGKVDSNNESPDGDDLFNLDIDSPADIILQQQFFGSDPVSAAPDLLGNASWRCVYDFSKTPVAAGMIARQHHMRNPLILTGQGSAPVIRISYSDALGRIIMHKAQCEPVTLPGEPEARQWIASGRTIYNNKGNAVMQFEPYFSQDHQCDDAAKAIVGVSPKMYYDPLNRVYKTELPDGTFTKTEWTAWQQKVWDNNDTVMNSNWYNSRIGGGLGTEEQEAAIKAAKHHDTPTLMHTDSLARPFYTIQHNRYPDNNDVQVDELIHSYVNLDIQGNRLSLVDGKSTHPDPADDTFCLQYRYHMLQGPGYQLSIDSGLQRTLTDVAGQPLYAWDASDQQFRMTYDTLRRLTGKYVAGQQFEKMVYGEGYSSADPKTLNLRGALYEAFDSSGKQAIPDGYDFKGSPLKTEQQLLKNKTLNAVDWDAAPPLLDPETFTTTALLDALNRPVCTTDPGNNVQEYIYDKGGALKQVKLNSSIYVNNILYDAKGQRQAIYYNNNTVTHYTYDPLTYRLRRLQTTANTGTDTRQDLYYFYDPVGNITRIKDEVQDFVFYNNSLISPHQVYTYDALYRLVIAKGREHISNTSFNSKDNYNDSAMMLAPAPLQWDINALQTYTQRFRYDAVGNILELKHSAGSGGYTRLYNYNNGNNRLSNTKIGTNPAFTDFTYDVRGNMTKMPHLSIMDWNSLNELGSIANNDLQAWYQYSGGQRIRKYVDKGSVFEERIYLGNFEIYRKFDATGSLKLIERTTVHISDDTGRIAMQEKRTFGNAADDNNTVTELTRYIYSNHLQSASLELDEEAEIISYEEYHPYGTTAYQAYNSLINATAKRYRYTGKERDDESGLYYHGARYYIPWLARWTSVDPLESKYAGMSPYNYSFNNPVMFNDPSGAEGEKLSTLKVEKEYYVGRAPSTHQVLVEKGWEVATSSSTNSKGQTVGISTVIGLRSPSGDTYVWNKTSNWFTNSDGKDYSNPGLRGFAFDVTNWIESSTKASLGQAAKDAIETGDPFKAIKESYKSYKKDGGNGGVLGYIGSGIKEAAVKTYDDVNAGGYRRNQAIIGIWQFSSGLAKGSLTSTSTKPISISLGTKERLASFSKKTGFPNYNTWKQLGYHSATSFDDAFHTTMEKVIKSGGTIAMDITDMDLNLTKMAKGLGLYDEVKNAAQYGAKYVRYTDWELNQVLSNKDYFKRVIFYNAGKIEDKLKIYNKFYGK